MNFENFFIEIRKQDIKLSFDNPSHGSTSRLSNEALFHLPLLAITILILAKDRRKPKIEELGQLVGECFERSFSGFKGSSQHLGWSANLRVRTVRALTFLETTNLVSMDGSRGRIAITPAGKRIIDAALDKESDLSYTLHLIERSYRNISVERQISQGLE